ncbi:MAG: hypothetical protein JW934_15170 [Anaerolineae bacterium]|nr:hypothetical protein [Anaerolineae bacterium]
MNKWSLTLSRFVVISLLVLLPAAVQSQTPVALQNAGFEGPPRQTLSEGTSLSSWLATDWFPWSVLGDSVNNREVEYKLITLETGRSPDLASHVYGGNHAQQFFTNGGSHTAGFYQKVKVPANSQVTFSIWAQIQTGSKLLLVDGRYVSDLSGGGGNYYVQVGIDPTGATPGGFSAPLPGSIKWSDPLWDITAWGKDEKGNPADLWVLLSVTAKAQGEWVTVYTRGQCKYPTQYNTSFWDDASLTVSTPPTPTSPPPTATRIAPPTHTPAPTPTPTETATTAAVEATATLEPTETATPEPTATSTRVPTRTLAPTHTPTPTAIAALPQPTATPVVIVVYATPEPVSTPTPLLSSGTVGLIVVGVLIMIAMGLGLGLGLWLAKK